MWSSTIAGEVSKNTDKGWTVGVVSGFCGWGGGRAECYKGIVVGVCVGVIGDEQSVKNKGLGKKAHHKKREPREEGSKEPKTKWPRVDGRRRNQRKAKTQSGAAAHTASRHPDTWLLGKRNTKRKKPRNGMSRHWASEKEKK